MTAGYLFGAVCLLEENTMEKIGYKKELSHLTFIRFVTPVEVYQKNKGG